MKYEVQTKFVCTGTFTAVQAKEFICKHCGLVIRRDIHTNLDEEDLDWNFDVHPDKIIGRVRKIA